MLQCTISLRPSNGRYPAQEGCQRIITKEQKWFKMMIRQQSHYKSFHKNLSSQSHQSRKNRLWFKPQKPRNPINRVWKRMGKSLKPSFSTSLNYRRKTKITGLREHAVWKGESQKDWFPLSSKAFSTCDSSNATNSNSAQRTFPFWRLILSGKYTCHRPKKKAMNMSDFMVFFLTLEMAFFSYKNQLSGWKFPHFRMSFKKKNGLFGFKSWVCLAWWIMWIPWRWFMLILKLLPFSTHDWKPTGQRNHTWLPSQVYLSHLLLDPSHLLLCRKTRWSSVDSRDSRDWLKYLPGVGHSHHYHTHTHTHTLSLSPITPRIKKQKERKTCPWTRGRFCESAALTQWLRRRNAFLGCLYPEASSYIPPFNNGTTILSWAKNTPLSPGEISS